MVDCESCIKFEKVFNSSYDGKCKVKGNLKRPFPEKCSDHEDKYLAYYDG